MACVQQLPDIQRDGIKYSGNFVRDSQFHTQRTHSLQKSGEQLLFLVVS